MTADAAAAPPAAAPAAPAAPAAARAAAAATVGHLFFYIRTSSQTESPQQLNPKP